jgi:transposase-like protein
MEAKTRRLEVSCCPRTYPCPSCGRRGRRKQILTREVRSIAFREICLLEVRYAEYRATCRCCRTFRSAPPGVDLRRHYDNRVRDAVLDRLIEDGMSIPKLLASMKRDFFLNLSEGFAYDCIRCRVAQLDQGDYRRWSLSAFRGVLCVDELHLGRFTLLLATDPLGDFPAAFALVEANDAEHMRRFLANLKRRGFSPEVVVTDGSSLYPALVAELWPQAEHQLCVFHVLADVNRCVLEAVVRLRRELKRRGRRGRKRRCGRPKKSARRRLGPTLADKANFVFKRRYLIVTGQERLDDRQRVDLETMAQYIPGVRMLRTFAIKARQLFDPGQSSRQAYCRRAALVRNERFAAVPELAAAMKLLARDKFDKMIAFLRSGAAKHAARGSRRSPRPAVRTNNHVERTNRKLRLFEKSRYKWRRRRSIVRFMLLAIDHWRRRAHAKAPPDAARRLSPASSQSTTRHPNSKAA